MAETPNLVIQLQRMGDLILSFPLLSWLGQADTGHPVWVVAETAFSQALMPLAPSVVFFPPEATTGMQGLHFRRIINLSHRPDAAHLIGNLRADRKIGAWESNGERRIHGVWSLYRASLVHNNRHNRFHWADLNALDSMGAGTMLRSVWPQPRQPQGNGRVGLFVGASEASKRPEPEFWAGLAEMIMRRGGRPVFLGGKAEATLGTRAAALAGLPSSNLCGRFSLADLVQFLRELDLLVTPDTGPMHVGAWAGVQTLNLSMGPVNAWETAPFPPGHFVLRPTASCTGCWCCTRCLPPQIPPCKARFIPDRVASLIHALLRGDGHLPRLPGLCLLRTKRTHQGLFALEPMDRPPSPRELVARFWQQWFLSRLGGPEGRPFADDYPPAAPAPDTALAQLAELHPCGLLLLKKALPRFQATLTGVLRRRSMTDEFWQKAPPALRPLSGYIQMSLENADFAPQAWLDVLGHLEHLTATVSAI